LRGEFNKDIIAEPLRGDGLVSKSVSEILVRLGIQVIDFLSQLIVAPKYVTRWEAVKSISGMHKLLVIPWLIDMLEVENYDIRWMAAEG